MAIALDASSGSFGVGVTSLTWAHTCTGSNLLLLVGFLTNNDTDIITGVTYNGVAMTKIQQLLTSTNSYHSYVWGLLAPATSANNIVISASGSSLIYAGAVSYTGVSQSALPTDIVTSRAEITTSWGLTITPSVGDSWVFFHGRLSDPVSTAPDTSRNVQETLNLVADSDAAVTGAYTINGTCTDSANNSQIAVAFAPAVAVTTNFFPFLDRR